MKKAALLLLGIFLILLFSLFNLPGDSNQEMTSRPNKPNEQAVIEEPNEDLNGNYLNESELLDLIVSYAEHGKISNDNIYVGRTDINEVIGRYGNYNQKDIIPKGTFVTFQKHDIAVGYDQEGLVFEARSYQPSLRQIHYETILEKLNKPNLIRYYKDKEVDQIILDYKLSEHYDLKFILPRPTDENPNPALHHTAVLKINHLNQHQVQYANVDEMIKEMSLNEKIGQLILSGFTGTNYSNELKELVQKYKIGGFIFYSDNLKNKQQSVKLINSLKKSNEQNPLPILFGVDQEGGRISRLPGDIGKLPTNAQIGKLNNPSFSYEIGQLLGEQVKAFGFNLDFAPVLDINSNPTNPVIGDRSFGKNPAIVSSLGIQTMKGIQSQTIVPAIKHFPGHGDTSVDSHLDLPVVNKSYKDLNSFELIPFKKAIQENTDAVMIAHILLPKIDSNYPASMSKTIITTILRSDLQFNGVVMTDDMTMDAIDQHFDLAKASVKSIQAGSDIIMVAHDTYKVKAVFKAIQAAVKDGQISEDRINQSVKRIILLKQKYKIDNQTVQNYSTDSLIDNRNKLLKKYGLEH